MRERKMAEESITGNPEEDEIKTEDCSLEVCYFSFIFKVNIFELNFNCYI